MLLMNLTEQTITRTQMDNAFSTLGIKVKLESMKPLISRKQNNAMQYGEMLTEFKAKLKVQWSLVLSDKPKYQKHICFAVEMGDYWTSSNIKSTFWYKYINAWMLNESMTKRAFIYETTTKQLVEIHPALDPLDSYMDIMETFRYIYDLDSITTNYDVYTPQVYSTGDRYNLKTGTFSFNNYIKYEQDDQLAAYEEEVTRLTGISMDDGRSPEELRETGSIKHMEHVINSAGSEGQPLMSNSKDFQDPAVMYFNK